MRKKLRQVLECRKINRDWWVRLDCGHCKPVPVEESVAKRKYCHVCGGGSNIPDSYWHSSLGYNISVAQMVQILLKAKDQIDPEEWSRVLPGSSLLKAWKVYLDYLQESEDPERSVFKHWLEHTVGFGPWDIMKDFGRFYEPRWD